MIGDRTARIGAATSSLLLAVGLTACGLSSGDHAATGATRIIVDTLGRQVTVPEKVTRVAAIGTIPVMISYIVTIGAQHSIVTRGGQSGSKGVGANGKQGFHSTELYEFVAPNVLSAPSVEAAIMAPVDTEALLRVHPDVVIAPDLTIARGATNVGLPTVILDSGATGDDVKRDIDVLGALFNKQGTAKKYTAYFDSTAATIRGKLADIPNHQKPTALFLAFSPLRSPIYSTNYMFPTVGARSVTANIPGNNVEITEEQLLQWNPDIIVVQQVVDQQALYADPRYASLKAVTNHRVFLIPMALQTWTDNSPLMPLGLDFLAKSFYPDRFRDLDLDSAVHSFFQQFCGVDLTDEQVTRILQAQL